MARNETLTKRQVTLCREAKLVEGDISQIVVGPALDADDLSEWVNSLNEDGYTVLADAVPIEGFDALVRWDDPIPEGLAIDPQSFMFLVRYA